MNMKLVVIVLNKTECLEDLLREFCRSWLIQLGFGGPEHKENRTIFMAAPQSSVPDIVDAVNKVTGGLDRSDTGILFTVPIDFITGIEVNDS